MGVTQREAGNDLTKSRVFWTHRAKKLQLENGTHAPLPYRSIPSLPIRIENSLQVFQRASPLARTDSLAHFTATALCPVLCPKPTHERQFHGIETVHSLI